MAGLRLKDRRDIEEAKQLRELALTFLALDIAYDKIKAKSVNSPTSEDFSKRATIAATARNEARAELIAFITTD